ncbi:MAG: hypothetical protein SV760_08365 [Halobacteria archaeon]|nr:hypothetical protein [Halobacteria archaeon]
MNLEIDGQTKVQLGIALAIGLVVGAGIGAFVGSTVLSGFSSVSADRDVIGGEEDLETCETGSSCIWLKHSGGYNVILVYYNNGEKVGETSSITGVTLGDTKYVKLNDVTGDVDRIKVVADALGACGGGFRSFSVDSEDYPVSIFVDGAICTKSASINKEYSGDSNGLV